MKTITMLLALSITSVTFAETITGTVKKFSGRYVESGKPYAYSALSSVRGRIILPDFIKADALAEIKDNKLTFDAEFEGMGCTDMSSACPSGMIINVKSVKIEIAPVKDSETFEGVVKRFKGMAVESRRLYNYVAIDAVSGERIAVPEFLDAEVLLKEEATVEIVGKVKRMMCTDMSAACGPAKVNPIESVEVWPKLI